MFDKILLSVLMTNRIFVKNVETVSVMGLIVGLIIDKTSARILLTEPKIVLMIGVIVTSHQSF